MLNNNSAVSKSVNQTNYWNKFIGHHSDATVEVSARADDDKLISFIKLEMGKKKSSTITKSSENKLGCKKPHNKEHDREHMFFERQKRQIAAAIDHIDFEKNFNILCAQGSYELEICDIVKHKKLGAGSQGSVFQATLKGYDNFDFVDKFQEVIDNEKVEDDVLNTMLREYSIGEKLTHPNVIKYHYFVRKHNPKTKVTEFHLLIEHMRGKDMNQYLKCLGPPLQIEKIKNVGWQIINGLAYLHDNNIIHQDLKPENIMFCGDFQQVKLIDFGVSNLVLDTIRTNRAGQGTVRYMSPE